MQIRHALFLALFSATMACRSTANRSMVLENSSNIDRKWYAQQINAFDIHGKKLRECVTLVPNIYGSTLNNDVFAVVNEEVTTLLRQGQDFKAQLALLRQGFTRGDDFVVAPNALDVSVKAMDVVLDHLEGDVAPDLQSLRDLAENGATPNEVKKLKNYLERDLKIALDNLDLFAQSLKAWVPGGHPVSSATIYDQIPALLPAAPIGECRRDDDVFCLASGMYARWDDAVFGGTDKMAYKVEVAKNPDGSVKDVTLDGSKLFTCNDPQCKSMSPNSNVGLKNNFSLQVAGGTTSSGTSYYTYFNVAVPPDNFAGQMIKPGIYRGRMPLFGNYYEDNCALRLKAVHTSKKKLAYVRLEKGSDQFCLNPGNFICDDDGGSSVRCVYGMTRDSMFTLIVRRGVDHQFDFINPDKPGETAKFTFTP